MKAIYNETSCYLNRSPQFILSNACKKMRWGDDCDCGWIWDTKGKGRWTFSWMIQDLLSSSFFLFMTFGYLETGHQFKVTLGKSLDPKPKKKAQKFFNVKSKILLSRKRTSRLISFCLLDTFSSDLGVFGKEAKLEKKNDRYQVEMKHTKASVSVILFEPWINFFQ